LHKKTRPKETFTVFFACFYNLFSVNDSQLTEKGLFDYNKDTIQNF